jgi:tungstate transport system permease protein
MNEFSAALDHAITMVLHLDADLSEIVGRSLYISLTAVLIACFIGFPIGAFLALKKFRGRGIIIIILNTLMGLPPVVVGLTVYLVLSRAGPFGVLGLLFTPTAMIVAQTLLIIPIVTALSRQTIEDLWSEYREQLLSFGVSTTRVIPTLLWDGRYALMMAMLAGFGRASAEVGAVMIVGGNIDHATRVMTTSIALETTKGNLDLALALGMILLAITLGINAVAQIIGLASKRFDGTNGSRH